MVTRWWLENGRKQRRKERKVKKKMKRRNRRMRGPEVLEDGAEFA